MNSILRVKNLSVWYHQFHAVKGISCDYAPHSITAIIGPSGCGKSSYLRAINRIYEEIPGARAEGEIFYGGQNILDAKVDAVKLRRHIGMVFQRPNPFPGMSVYENVTIGPKLGGVRGSENLLEICQTSLEKAALWEEVKDKLHHPAEQLSGGQQQRLCLARSLAVNPVIVLMDEPTSALDPIATGKIEELMFELKKDYTLIVVTHNIQQAARIADHTSFFVLGELIEHGANDRIFTNPQCRQTEDYISGRFG